MNPIQTLALVVRSVSGVWTTRIAALCLAGCAAAYPAVSQPMADVESAARSATELGAQNNPQAQLYLKLANEQLKQAKTAAANDDNVTADRLLMRAKADAELAVALTHGGSAKARESKAIAESTAARVPDVQANDETGVTP